MAVQNAASWILVFEALTAGQTQRLQLCASRHVRQYCYIRTHSWQWLLSSPTSSLWGVHWRTKCPDHQQLYYLQPPSTARRCLNRCPLTFSYDVNHLLQHWQTIWMLFQVGGCTLSQARALRENGHPWCTSWMRSLQVPVHHHSKEQLPNSGPKIVNLGS